MTDISVDTLRIRGPRARRLARVAVQALPAALERALADVGDVAVDTVAVTLELDVDGYDDDTLAVLWADAIRARVMAVMRGSRRPTGRALEEANFPALSQPDAAEVLAVARAWLGATPGQPDVLPRALLALGDVATAQAVEATTTPDEWSALLAALAAAIIGPRVVSTVSDSGPGGVVAPAAIAPPRPSERAAPGHDPRQAPRPVRVGSTPVPEPREVGGGEVLATAARLANLVTGHSTVVDTVMISRAAGIVLVYPWLAEHCRSAQDLHPNVDPLEVREVALAAVVDPENPALADDPLVRLLAGRLKPPAGEPRLRGPLSRMPDLAESATRVLTSFTGLLPGFERSTPAFVRSSWIARLGLIDVARDPVLLLAASQPLDVVLPRLPYPSGLLKLPWSPPVSVRFRP